MALQSILLQLECIADDRLVARARRICASVGTLDHARTARAWLALAERRLNHPARVSGLRDLDRDLRRRWMPDRFPECEPAVWYELKVRKS